MGEVRTNFVKTSSNTFVRPDLNIINKLQLAAFSNEMLFTAFLKLQFVFVYSLVNGTLQKAICEIMMEMTVKSYQTFRH